MSMSECITLQLQSSVAHSVDPKRKNTQQLVASITQSFSISILHVTVQSSILEYDAMSSPLSFLMVTSYRTQIEYFEQ